MIEKYCVMTYMYAPNGQPLNARLYPRVYDHPNKALGQIKTDNQEHDHLSGNMIVREYLEFVEKLSPLKGDECQHLYQTSDGIIISANYYEVYEEL